MPRENQLPRIPDPFADSPADCLSRKHSSAFFFFCVLVSSHMHAQTELSSLSSTKVHYNLIINVFDIVIYRNVMLHGPNLLYA